MTAPNPPTPPESDWLTRATPLAETDVELASKLRAQLISAMRSLLTDEEEQFLDVVAPPTIVTGMHDNMDGRFLGVLHGGAQLAFSWDGTSEDAERVIDLAAENRAENLSTDYWVTSGWRT